MRSPRSGNRVVVLGVLPSFLTGCRLALGGAWMSVICAEFIATSKGFGYIMVEAQVRMNTPLFVGHALVAGESKKLVAVEIDERIRSDVALVVGQIDGVDPGRNLPSGGEARVGRGA